MLHKPLQSPRPRPLQPNGVFEGECGKVCVYAYKHTYYMHMAYVYTARNLEKGVAAHGALVEVDVEDAARRREGPAVRLEVHRKEAVCVCARACARVRACVCMRACVRACARAREFACARARECVLRERRRRGGGVTKTATATVTRSVTRSL